MSDEVRKGISSVIKLSDDLQNRLLIILMECVLNNIYIVIIIKIIG